MEKYKTCSKCKQLKESSCFYADRRSPTGLQPQCKQCIKKWRDENRDRLAETKRRYRQTDKAKETARNYARAYKLAKPEIVKKAQLNYVQKLGSEKRERFRVWSSLNKERIKQNRKKAMARNPELYRSFSAQRRARLRAASSFYVSKEEIIAIYKMPCFYCKQPGGTLDHVIPLSRGGSHSIGNLLPACKSCNSQKRDRTIMEWKKSMGGTLPHER